MNSNIVNSLKWKGFRGLSLPLDETSLLGVEIINNPSFFKTLVKSLRFLKKCER